jgi:Recombinase
MPEMDEQDEPHMPTAYLSCQGARRPGEAKSLLQMATRCFGRSPSAFAMVFIEALRAEGITSATGIAKALNERGIPTARGGRWQAVQVQRLERARR